VEERERDVPNLYARCLSVLDQVAPGIQTLPPARGYPPSELATLVTDYLRDALPGKVIYVLDDVQYLAGSPAAELWLRTVVAHLPPTCHLILLSRRLPNLPFAEMIARREVVAIGQEQLRLTPDEIYSLACEMLDSPPPMAEIEEIASRLEGWPAGTVLALHPLPVELGRDMLSGGDGPEALFDTLASSMLRTQPPGLRDFLLASSTLSRLTPELCSAVLGLTDSSEWLTEAQIRNLFLSRASGGLVYHALFRNFLQRQQKADDPDRFASLHTKAAQWFEAQGQVDEAFDHYVAAGLIERAAAVAERVAPDYFAQDKIETLLSWSAQLTQAGARPPGLLYTCAKIHTDRYEYEVAEAELVEAERGFTERNDEVGIAYIQLQRARINLQRGEYNKAISQAAQAVQDPPEPGELHARALRILGFAYLRLGEVEAAARHLEEALQLYRLDGDACAISRLLQDLQIAYIRLGRLDDSGACLQELIALQRSLGGAGALALALNNLGYYYHQRSDYDQAISTLQEGLSIATRVSDRRAEGHLLWSLGDIQRDLGVFDEALRMYDQALALLGGSEPSPHSAILVSASTLRRWQGELREAVLLAEEASGLASAHDIALENATARAAFWAARAQLGEAAEALGHLETVAAALDEQGARFELTWVLGLCAHVGLLCSDPPSAQRYLQSALRVAQGVGSAQSLAAEVAHTPALETLVTDSAAKHDPLICDLERLRKARLKLTSHVQASGRVITDVTYSLRVLTLGRESIECDGEPVPASKWRAAAAREMFLYLLFLGPETRERTGLAFWPDSTPERVRSSFHTTLYRARQALGENVIVFQDGLYLINPDLDVWCDAHEVEDLARRACLLPPRDARTEDLWRRAVELCQGDFLPSLDARWVIARREALRETYLEALIGLGECARARNNLREALNWFKRALDIDPYREDVYREIMICYAGMGEKNQILVHLHELQALLREDLGIEPSAETMALAEALLD
jgi:LuxR family maltose regulon positive regulatory protein